MLKNLAIATCMALCAAVAGGQAPANAPAGTHGICKDGTYSGAASKDGACRGHKGVQTWYAASSSPATRPVSPSMPAPTPASSASAPSLPVPTQTGSLPSIAPPARKGPAAAAAAKPQAPGGGPGLVWVNTSSNVYHCNGDPYYGKTKAGSYMSEADAKAKGAHGVRGESCAGK